MKPKNSNIAFENEYMITDLDKKPITTIDGYDTSQILIDHIKDIDISAKKAVEDFLISPELDSCQIETRNKWAHSSLENAQEELLALHEYIEQAAKYYGVHILKGAVPNQDYIPRTSTGSVHYQEVHKKLMSKGIDIRKGSNITGLHMHIDTDPEFRSFTKISHHLHKIFHNNDYDTLGLSQERHNLYTRVVQAVAGIEATASPVQFENNVHARSQLVDIYGNPLSSYSYVTAKKFGEQFTTEIRTADSAPTKETLIEQTNKIYNLAQEAIAQ